jgi:hypothetical protein
MDFSLRSARKIDFLNRKRIALGLAEKLRRISGKRTARRDLSSGNRMRAGDIEALWTTFRMLLGRACNADRYQDF